MEEEKKRRVSMNSVISVADTSFDPESEEAMATDEEALKTFNLPKKKWVK